MSQRFHDFNRLSSQPRRSWCPRNTAEDSSKIFASTSSDLLLMISNWESGEGDGGIENEGLCSVCIALTTRSMSWNSSSCSDKVLRTHLETKWFWYSRSSCRSTLGSSKVRFSFLYKHDVIGIKGTSCFYCLQYGTRNLTKIYSLLAILWAK